MKNNYRLRSVILAALVLVVYTLTTCKKDDDEPTADPNKPAAPSAYTDTTTFISQKWATLNSLVTANNLPTTISFEYDTTTSYGYIVPANPDTLSGKTTSKRIAEITGLTPNTTYHYRVKAVNSLGISYGNDKTFTTLPEYEKDIVFNPDLTYGEITDIEGNTYKTIEIGTQVWMAENLAATKFNDGTDIFLATNITSWTLATDPAYSWYNNSLVDYGALYNWYAVNSGKLCPAGWHVGTDDEWTTLSTFLGGSIVAGSKLKETGTIHWQSPNSGATNSSGFSALPGGYRYYNGAFNAVKRYGYWWTSSETTVANGYGRDMYYGYSNLDRITSDKRSGASVRCIKD
ncbi:MAG: hypothetical protein A2X05_09425 [Bacteroidetes bacterium GWE2_41_25]|nr:MAG: hypothetical protein A2X03_05130 [Bacteroidetes bacterium GWA2_40_15]OFX92841.1 MAG: hypothetical protein A2X06_02350 [Bacteroidetes bacterium GWC2_40_22]OFY05491.1 MAG: hypothetical protein A2X05_09425 [Bacteroidetes bacterium GWE2_41_25]HAM11541.1 hypothetical protein [Bacteroidales bacterium]HBH84000.1 hypothetical protein [Bacteroidales bacterium]